VESIFGAVIVWVLAIIFFIFPEEVLKVQKELYKAMDAEFNYSAQTVKLIRGIGLILVLVGVIVWFFG